MAQIHDPTMREIGAKLANFRRKLGDAIGRKITQAVFGEMYGHYTMRRIETYEGGTSEIPAKLLFILWQQGNSIDAIFNESAVTDVGREQAQKLLAKSLTAKLENMDDAERGRLKAAILETTINDKKRHDRPTQKTIDETSGKPKGGGVKAGKIKKR